MKKIAFLSLIFVLMVSCKSGSGDADQSQPLQGIDYTTVVIPLFNQDSAYAYTANQLSFGYRYPGTKGHEQCVDYLARMMQRWCDTVIVQSFSTTLWDHRSVRGKNIIASLNMESDNRILLGAHWDSRQWADQDPEEANHHQPILGANDGASAVGTLMEMARIMSAQRPDVGIDFVFFDLEDQGIPAFEEGYEDNSWCKGSQYWSQYPHRPYYRANYGILFDMIGVANPRFTKEEVSRTYAPGVTNKLWNAASALGYANIFVDANTPAILDDHLYVNQILGVPMVDIVQNSVDCSFYPYWHTVKDDLDAVLAESLAIVANVTMKVIYGDYPTP